METHKSVIVYYGEIAAARENQFSSRDGQTNQEIFIVGEEEREEVPAEYADHPEEYYRLKFKQRGYEVTLRSYPGE